MSTLPSETSFTDLELEFMENEPPGLFPQNQNSYWGQLRRVLSDKLQEVADLLATFYLNQSAQTVNEDDAIEWEQLLNIPVSESALIEERRSVILSRLSYGPFTRTRRRQIVENFLTATVGPATDFDPEGIPLDSDGVPLSSGVFDVSTLYTITENISAFSYTVSISSAASPDIAGLTRELLRITPAGISFTIVLV